MREDISPQVLSCSRFRNNQIELRKRQIQKDKNTENRTFNSNKNFVEITETWKMLEELHFLWFYILYRWYSQLHSDDIVNKSVVFRITETFCHITDV